MKIIISVIALVLLAAPASFASSIELARTDNVNSVSVLVEKPITSQLGAFVFSTQNKFWGQSYVGMSYAPIPNVQCALGAGYETGGARVGGWIWAGKDRVSGIYAFENGATGPWHKLVAKYTIAPRLSLGYTKKSYAGEGVYADFQVSKTVTVKYSGFKTPEVALNIRF